MGRRTGRAALGLLTACLLGAFTMAATAGTAAADYKEKTGHSVTPGQPYGGEDRSADWLGSYEVDGKQVFCVQFEFKAPDTDEKYQPGDELLTKWGEKLAPETAANISYLLLRYGDTANKDEAAALAHLLHSWTSPARPGHDDLNRDNDFEHIAYDTSFHLEKLPAAAKTAVETLEKDAEANRGPWTAEVSPAEGGQTIGTAAEWTVTVHNAKEKGVPEVPVKLKLADGTFEDGKDTTEVETGEDGKATVKVTPSGENPKLTATLDGPAAKPYVQLPTVDTKAQRVVSTGGEQELVAEGSTSAQTKPGGVRVTKLDGKTGKGIAGVALRVTAKDKETAATGQDGKPLTGADGKPAVVTTSGEDGRAEVPNLKTPQEICVVEVSAPDGYGDGFDPANPPAACGSVAPGETLALEIKNAPNEVPRVIPAGSSGPVVLASSATTTGPATGAVLGLGGLAVLGSALVGMAARRRWEKR
ncbi:MSCRAMM family protein [Amycolatopsis nigrescens]|uniref:MSCRAMM family protein n=1 Tax=Amycolatopsis nigrescens TaxID=381445 RepID=UPI00036F0864|nr:SpaA isopeptide-forming pilin-related protein [Amycolatopsis nigrescens]